jgi:multidrug resistance efflux pump
VRKGDLLVEISDNDPQILTRILAERDATLNRLEATERAINASKKNLSRQRSLEEQGLSSRRSFELADLEYARYLTDAANASAELARIEVRLARQQAQTITATADGFISRVHGGQGGEMVKSGDLLLTIVPETTSRAVELWIRGNDAPLVSEGRHVRLQFEGWPALQFSGWPSVAVGTFGGKIAVIDATDNGKGEFRVLIVPDGDQPWPSGKYLRQGVRAYGWVLLNSVSLGYEVWRQFNGFPPVIAEDEPGAKSGKAGK